MKRYESMSKEEIIRFLTPSNDIDGINSNRSDIMRYKIDILLNDVIANVDSSGNDKVVSGFVFMPKHLQFILDLSYDRAELNSTQIRFRTMWWLIYLGVRPSDIFNIKKEDINIDELYIKYNHTELEMCNESVQVISKCKNLTYFTKRHSNDSGNESFSKEDRIVSEALLSGIKFSGGKSGGKPSENYRSLTMQAEKYIRDAFQKSDIIITTRSVYLSGLFYRMFLKECIGGVADFSEIATDDFYQSGHTNESVTERRKKDIISRKNRNYLELYKAWKELLPR